MTPPPLPHPHGTNAACNRAARTDSTEHARKRNGGHCWQLGCERPTTDEVVDIKRRRTGIGRFFENLLVVELAWQVVLETSQQAKVVTHL
jgi:hypothetical protein